MSIMAVQVTINSIVGTQPYQVYICQPGNTGCFYIDEINNGDVPYVFDIPAPYDNANSYLLKIIDNFGCIISGTTSV
jgi:hypothetical protein